MLIHGRTLGKIIAGRALFTDVDFKVRGKGQIKDKIGLIGPNGAGKSTLLKILAGLVEADSGEILTAKGCKIAYLAQEENFAETDTLEAVVCHALDDAHMSELEKQTQAAITLGRMGFDDPQVLVSSLSGGWKKRLALTAQLAREPDVLLLDEPTNHLDMEGIEWLESLLKSASFAYVVISHDRTFLENTATTMVEINDCFPNCSFRVEAPYSKFLEQRTLFLEGQISTLESAANKARNEDAWLKQGVKARGTRQKARSQSASALFEELKTLKQRTLSPKSLQLDFQDTERKTKRLIVAHSLCKGYGETRLVSNFNLTLSPKMRIGLIGYNGSGKTTLMKLLSGHLTPDSGTVTHATGIRCAVFDQARTLIDKEKPLREALAPTGTDAVIFQDKEIHLETWARKLKFRSHQLDAPVGALSGGEQARVLLGQLMLTKADVLFLDEPTNDLDIPSLEVLEESLQNFPGAVVFVTHDREMLDRVSTHLLGLDGKGNVTPYASVAQWKMGCSGGISGVEEPVKETAKAEAKAENTAPKAKPKNTNKEQAKIEKKIARAEDKLADLHAEMPDGSDMDALYAYSEKLGRLQREIDALYAEWEALD